MTAFPHKLPPVMRRAIMVLVLACALSVGAPALAGAASGGTASDAITDCNDNGKLTQQYSSEVLRQALAQMPADVREYTDCFDVIERQLFAQLGTSGANTTTTGSGSSSSFLPTWLIVVIVLLALAAITFGALALRRRGEAEEAGGPEGAAPGEPGGPGEPPTEPLPPGEPPTELLPPSEPPTEPGDSEGPGDAGGPPG
jgi:hypothetical protein